MKENLNQGEIFKKKSEVEFVVYFVVKLVVRTFCITCNIEWMDKYAELEWKYLEVISFEGFLRINIRIRYTI